MIRIDTTTRFGFFLAFMCVCAVHCEAEAYQCDWDFSPQVQYPTGENATGVDAADMNGDGYKDLVVAHRDTDNVVVLLNDGNGEFYYFSKVLVGWHFGCQELTEAQCSAQGGEWQEGTDCDPCAGMGVTTGLRTPSTRESNDRGPEEGACFGLWMGGTPRYVETGDLDGDGDVDAATPNWDGNTVSILINDGTGTLTEKEQYPFCRPSCIAVEDIDGDGDVDIIVPHWDPNADGTGSQSDGLVSILLNNGDKDMTFEEVIIPIGIQPRGVAVGDLDGDGDLDFAVANYFSHDITIVENLGNGNFQKVATLDSPFTQPRDLAIGDLDQDGLNDIAVVNKKTGEAKLSIFHNDGNMQFSWSEEDIYDTAANPHSVEIADLNGDCDLDVIVSHVGAAWLYVFENNGQGHFEDRFDIYCTGGPAQVIAADVDNDWDLDLITANTNNGSVNVFINQTCCVGDIDGDGTVGVIDLLAIIGAWGGPCVGDINGDGTVDVIDLLAIIGAWGNTGGPEDLDEDGIVAVGDLLIVISNLGCTGNIILDECDIPGDLNGDGVVDVTDLLAVVSAWGSCP